MFLIDILDLYVYCTRYFFLQVIERCVFNAGWIESCYGASALQKIGSNTVSCSGVSFGTKEAVMVYAELILQQLEMKNRYEDSSQPLPPAEKNKRCISVGMDQGTSIVVYLQQFFIM
jgi:hypothetical protein